MSDYGSEAWGYETREAINKIHFGAARVFLGVPKNTTAPGVLAEINWLQPIFRAQIRMIRHYYRVCQMSDNRISKLIMQWDKQLAEHGNFATWYSEVKSILDENNITSTVTPSENTSGYINTLKKVDNLEKFLSDKDYVSSPISIVSFVKASRQAYYNNNPFYYSMPNNRDKNFILRYIADGYQNNISEEQVYC